ncbi:MAG: DUF4870 domain-containing protein [Planctomycetales bacterium]|nr:DUF4870 domain-containing protein [Planctomycetales bacterium]
MDSEKVPPVKSAEFSFSDDDRTWGMLAHLSYFLTFVIGVSCVAPLVIWVIKKDTSEFIEDQAKEALNFQLSAFIVSLVLAATVCGIPLILVVCLSCRLCTASKAAWRRTEASIIDTLTLSE